MWHWETLFPSPVVKPAPLPVFSFSFLKDAFAPCLGSEGSGDLRAGAAGVSDIDSDDAALDGYREFLLGILLGQLARIGYSTQFTTNSFLLELEKHEDTGEKKDVRSRSRKDEPGGVAVPACEEASEGQLSSKERVLQAMRLFENFSCDTLQDQLQPKQAGGWTCCAGLARALAAEINRATLEKFKLYKATHKDVSDADTSRLVPRAFVCGASFPRLESLGWGADVPLTHAAVMIRLTPSLLLMLDPGMHLPEIIVLDSDSRGSQFVVDRSLVIGKRKSTRTFTFSYDAASESEEIVRCDVNIDSYCFSARFFVKEWVNPDAVLSRLAPARHSKMKTIRRNATADFVASLTVDIRAKRVSSRVIGESRQCCSFSDGSDGLSRTVSERLALMLEIEHERLLRSVFEIVNAADFLVAFQDEAREIQAGRCLQVEGEK